MQKMKLPRWLIVFLALVMAFSASSGIRMQQGVNGDTLSFVETRYTVSGPFRQLYQSAKEPLVVFGFPISDVLDHPIKRNVKVQYFQRARMEYDPGRPQGEQVTLAPLGEYFFDEANSGEDYNIATASGNCRYFEGVAYPVCYLFRSFYDKHQGERFFGLPISNVRMINGRVVQYFQGARMEWWPEKPLDRQVVLTDLGQLDLIRSGAQLEYLPPAPGSSFQVLVRLFPAKPLVGVNETQTVFVIVQDQRLDPIPGAEISYRLLDINNRELSSQGRVYISDESGIARLADIPSMGVKPGDFVKVQVVVRVKNYTVPVQAETCFRVWW